MYRMTGRISPALVLIVMLLSISFARAQSAERTEPDPHRPACVDAHCFTAKSFVQAHYCGASPFGNGPDDSCEIKKVVKAHADVEVVADFSCGWNDSTHAAECDQRGKPSQVVGDVLIGELHRIGLPANATGQTYFTVWKAGRSGWSIAVASYSRITGSVLDVCEVVAIIDEKLHATVLREQPFQTTDVEVPTITSWALVDLADVEGTGQKDIVLEGDEYEDHWLEVISLRDGAAKTVFSGLGYYL